MEENWLQYLSQYTVLSEEEKEYFLSLDLLKHYSKHSFVLKEGDPIKDSFFVIKGCLRAFYILEKQEKTTSFFLEEELIIPQNFSKNNTSECYIRCEEDCLLLASNPNMEQEAFQKFPQLERICNALLEKVLNKQQMDFTYYIKHSPEERYQRLCETKPSLLQRVPQYQIASFIGVQPETLSRIRKKIANV